jgi:hypothetical protein
VRGAELVTPPRGRPLWTKKPSAASSEASSRTGASSDSETCDACDTVLAKDQVLMEGVTLDLGGSHILQLHVGCFQMWEHERRAV